MTDKDRERIANRRKAALAIMNDLAGQQQRPAQVSPWVAYYADDVGKLEEEVGRLRAELASKEEGSGG